jgi:hypothetical protein
MKKKKKIIIIIIKIPSEISALRLSAMREMKFDSMGNWLVRSER